MCSSDLDPRRVLVVGDSIACSLVVGLEQAAPPSTQVGNGAVIACGVVAGEVESTVWGRPRGQRRCPRYVRDTERRAQASLGGRADAVLWLSTWERFDLVSGSSVLRAGTKAWESALRHRYDRAIARFRRAGARVYLVLPAPSTNGSFGGHAVRTTRAADITMMRLREFLQRYAASRPRAVGIVDLQPLLCPGGPPCPPTVHGRRLRPVDGTHFDPRGATRAASWVYRYLAGADPAQQARSSR